MSKKKKIKIPKSVLDLRMSPKKYAKKHNIRIKGKKLKKRDIKHNLKRLNHEYSAAAITGLNKAVKILAENPDGKKMNKVKDGVDNIITRPTVMLRIAKLYKKHPDYYKNMMFLPYMIMNTLVYYKSEELSDDDKKIAESLDPEMLIEFCERILKKQIRHFENMGIDHDDAYQLAVVIPTTKLFENSGKWYNYLIKQLYDIASTSEVDVDLVIKAILKLDKKKDRAIDKKSFLEGFYSEFIMKRSSNKDLKFTDTQKELQETLIEHSLTYLDGLKEKKVRDILRGYIKRRKTAESYKTDGKRVIKFTDHANSNSPYPTIKAAVQDLIESNANNELYLS